ncbi:unnamed protein product [Cladocopium goreaui]|uniref:Glycosyltransferase-like protein LARGE2 n=1 Tax=Cladocopium goreaui TaxID=2562237 RepID=A0A9P1G756_9DINO|nr:unnamed protein product [Cladocopium goreaui]
MPPKKKNSDLEPKAKGKAKPKASAAIAPLLDAENAAALASTGAKYNLELMTSTFEALEELTRNTWPGIFDEEPLPLGMGANQLKAALFPGGVANPSSSYVCSQSIFKCDLLFNADPSVPLRQKSINELGARYYENPARFHTRIHVAISPDWHLSCDPQKVKPGSPVENVMGFVLSMFRDNEDEEKIAQWKRYALSVTESFVETAVSLHKRVFSNTKLLDLLLEADECPSDANPFNSYTKLQVIVHKAKSPRNVEWCFCAMKWGWKSELISEMREVCKDHASFRAQADKEIKEAKKKSGEENAEDDEDDVQLVEEPVEMEEDEKGTGHLKVPESVLKTRKRGTKNQSTDGEPLDLDEESLRRLDAFKLKACNMVRTHVKLIVEEDTKLAGEAGTQPSLRVPPLREGRHGKLFMSALGLRLENGTMRPGDCMIIMDGGREGILSACGTEEAGLVYKKRRHYGGTSHGDCIGPVLAPDWDDEKETWRVTYGEKKLLYGTANRIAVGGRADEPVADHQKGIRRKDTDVEPVAYHSLPSEAVAEVFHEFNISAMLDLRMLDPESPIFELTLLALVQKKKSKNLKEDEEEEQEDEEMEDPKPRRKGAGVEKLIHVYGSGFPCQPFSSIGRITGRAKVVGESGAARVVFREDYGVERPRVRASVGKRMAVACSNKDLRSPRRMEQATRKPPPRG